MFKIKKYILNKERGFTLIELMLALSIIGLVVSLSTGFMVDIFKIVRPSSERMNTKQMAEIRLTEIASYVRNAKKSGINVNDNEIITTSDQILKKDQNSNSILIFSSGGDIIRSLANINDFKIEAVDTEIFEITVEICRDKDCDKAEEVSTKISTRN